MPPCSRRPSFRRSASECRPRRSASSEWPDAMLGPQSGPIGIPTQSVGTSSQEANHEGIGRVGQCSVAERNPPSGSQFGGWRRMTRPTSCGDFGQVSGQCFLVGRTRAWGQASKRSRSLLWFLGQLPKPLLGRPGRLCPGIFGDDLRVLRLDLSGDSVLSASRAWIRSDRASTTSWLTGLPTIACTFFAVFVSGYFLRMSS